jgi:hypothetical protein
MQTLRSATVIALTISVWTVSLPSAFADQRGLPVGEVKDIAPDDSDAVWLTHPGEMAKRISAYQSVYTGDTIDVREPGVTARLEMALVDGGSITVTKANSPYHVNSRMSAATAMNFLKNIQRSFSWVFNPPPDPKKDGTFSKGPNQTVGLTASPWLPVTAQKVRAGEAQTYVVAWIGNSADVSLTDDETGALIQTTNVDTVATPGFALIQCKKLRPGSYTLTIDDHLEVLRIPITADIGGPDWRGRPVDRALAASNRLVGDNGERLQALTDLQAVADKVYVAKAIIDAVREGRTRQ